MIESQNQRRIGRSRKCLRPNFVGRRKTAEVTMKTILRALFTLLVIATSSVLAQDKPVSILSYEDTSCGAWSQSADVEWARAQYVSWFRGFVSGYNFGNSDNQVHLERMPNKQTLYLYIDKYCRDNPLNPFVSAAFKLVEELRERSVPKKGNSR
jgi:hypothetical protein